MVMSRTTLQAFTRTLANDRELTLNAGDGQKFFDLSYLGIFNPSFKYMGVQIGRRWPERTLVNTSLTMVAGTAQYTWPTSPVIKEPYFLEGLDVNASNIPYEIPPVTNSSVWSELDDTNNAQPYRHRLVSVSGVLKLELRPSPDQADPIRITSLSGVSRFPSTASTTVDVDSAAAQTVLSVTATTPFTAADHVTIGEGTAREESAIISSVSDGVSITLVSNLTYAHTAAQGDTVELATVFDDEEHDMALARIIAAMVQNKRGFGQSAQELVANAAGQLPIFDSTPSLRSGGFIQPWSL